MDTRHRIHGEIVCPLWVESLVRGARATDGSTFQEWGRGLLNFEF